MQIFQDFSTQHWAILVKPLWDAGMASISDGNPLGKAMSLPARISARYVRHSSASKVRLISPDPRPMGGGLTRSILPLCLFATCASAQAQQAPASPAETDPVKMGWMQGSPPPSDKQIRYRDGSYYQFPKTRWSFAHMPELVPTVPVLRGNGKFASLPVALRSDLDEVEFTPLGQTGRMKWVDAVEAVYSDAILVMHKGKIVYERYFGVMTRDQPHIAYSVTKSYFGTLAEMLIAEGKIDENAFVTRYVPELAQSGFGDATVRQVLDMTTGLDFSEDYTDPNAHITKFAFSNGLLPVPENYKGPRTSYQYLQSVGKKGVHGSGFTYKSVNTEVVGWIIARASGKPAHTLLSERIWSKIGAEHGARIIADPIGTPVTSGGLNLTLRDMARFGEAVRLNGRFNGQQIIPASVVAKIRFGASKTDFASAGYNLLPGWSYKCQWWISHNAHGAFSARGIHGQAIYIDPKAEMVIARFASNPMAGNANFDGISLPAYQAIAEMLMRKQ